MSVPGMPMVMTMGMGMILLMMILKPCPCSWAYGRAVLRDDKVRLRRRLSAD
jgi:hypothetical protein